MAEFLDTEHTVSALVDLINGADKRLVFISPYVKMPERILERLKDVCRRGSVEMILVCRKEDLKPEERAALAQIPRLTLRFLKNLHAKCFYNDSAMVITSLNLHEHSQQNNREMGIYLTRQDDGETFIEALDEAEFIIRQAESEEAKEGKTEITRQESDKRDDSIGTRPVRSKRESPRGEQSTGHAQSGHCIRCGKDIPYNMEAPYCTSCYSTWKRFKNPDHEEEHCHWCGKPNESTTMERPLCYSCYRKLRRNRSLTAG